MTRNHSVSGYNARKTKFNAIIYSDCDICSLALRQSNIFQTLKPSFAFDVHFGEELRSDFSMNNFLAPRLCRGFKNLLIILTITIPAGKGGGNENKHKE